MTFAIALLATLFVLGGFACSFEEDAEKFLALVLFAVTLLLFTLVL